MAQPYVGEIRMFGGNFPPNGWMFCQGQTLSIAENEVLFQLIGTTYGGDGQETFALPNLASRVPIHMGSGGGANYIIGEMAGTETVTLSIQQIPQHTHQAMGSLNAGTSQSPTGTVPAVATSTQPNVMMYGSDSSAAMNGQMVANTGGSQPHENCQPFLVINYIISLFGVFPSQT